MSHDVPWTIVYVPDIYTPDDIYVKNVTAPANLPRVFYGYSFDTRNWTSEANQPGMGVVKVLGAVRGHHESSAVAFGKSREESVG